MHAIQILPTLDFFSPGLTHGLSSNRFVCAIGFTARRYVRAAFAVVVCLIYLSATSRYCIETTGRNRRLLVYAWRLPSTFPTLCYEEIWVSLK